MRYTVNELARMSGLTPRTLRYYDAIGLLRPARDSSNDYRQYAASEVERLQHILLYREMGLPLEDIRQILDSPGFDQAGALRQHLERLQAQRRRVEELIRTVSRTLDALEGGSTMENKEKFEGMKLQAIQENEAVYGQEIREKYGDRTVEAVNRRFGQLREEDWKKMKEAETGYLDALRRAVSAGDPEGSDAQEACRLHRTWLLHYWTPEMLTPKSHRELVEMYSRDERFREYYEKVAPDCAAFFGRAVQAFYRDKEE